MAKARKSPGKSAKLSGSQIKRLRSLLEKALLDAAFRRQLLANPRKVLAQYRIGLTAVQLRRFDRARKALLQKARELERAAVKSARKLAKQARLFGMPMIR